MTPEARLRKYGESIVCDIRDIPALLPEGVDRAHVEAEWNHPPLYEQPRWWDDDSPPAWANGKSWLRFLVDMWHEELLKPPTPAQRRSREMMARAGRCLSVDMTAVTIGCLVSKEAADRFREESAAWIRDGVANEGARHDV